MKDSLGLAVPGYIMQGNSDCDYFEQSATSGHCEHPGMLSPGKNNKSASTQHQSEEREGISAMVSTRRGNFKIIRRLG